MGSRDERRKPLLVHVASMDGTVSGCEGDCDGESEADSFFRTPATLLRPRNRYRRHLSLSPMDSALSRSLHQLDLSSVANHDTPTSPVSNLMPLRMLGFSDPVLSTSTREASNDLVLRKSSFRSNTRKVKIPSDNHANMYLSPISPSPSLEYDRRADKRRWSYTASISREVSVTPSNVSSTSSSQERLNQSYNCPSSQERLNHCACDEINNHLINRFDQHSPMKTRSRSLSPSRGDHTETAIHLMNAMYRERFPKAISQMEEDLHHFVETHKVATSEEDNDPIVSFVQHQLVELARDCLEKSREQKITGLYFNELAEKTEKLIVEARERISANAYPLVTMGQTLLMIIARSARLLECLEFDPETFYLMLESTEGEGHNENIKRDLPSYIVRKLGLNRADPLKVDYAELIDTDSGRPDTPDTDELNCLNPRPPPSEADFDYIKLISNGAYGAVYLVRHRLTRQRFALKKMSKQNLALRNMVDQVFAERDILMFAENPFVVSMFCSYETKKHVCMVMEYVEGGDVATLLKNISALPLDLARMYFAETVLAVEYLHNYGIVHRDLKPDNLLITSEGHIKLTDFGLSRMGLMNLTTNLYEGSLASDVKMFSDNQVCGTPQYIAPECILRQYYGKPVDWWSMGIILYEFLNGCTPFWGNSAEEIFNQTVTEQVVWPEDDEYCEEARDLVSLLLIKDPLQRLGAVAGAIEVKNHMFFRGLNWTQLIKLKSEFIPQLEGEEDTSYFDSRTDRYNHSIDEDSDSETSSNDPLSLSNFSSCSPHFHRMCSRLTSRESSCSSGSGYSTTPDFGLSELQSPNPSSPHTTPSREPLCKQPSTSTPESSDSNSSPSNRRSLNNDTLPTLALQPADTDIKPRTSHYKSEPEISMKALSPEADAAAASGNRKSVVKSASASLLSLTINTHDKSNSRAKRSKLARQSKVYNSKSRAKRPKLVRQANVSGEAVSSRDASPTREHKRIHLPRVPPLKPLISIQKGGQGFGFTLRAIRVFYGHSNVYSIQHLVMAVDPMGPAWEAGLRPMDLISQVNNESVQGWLHIDVVKLIAEGGNTVTILATPLDKTSIKSGGRNHKGSSSKTPKLKKRATKQKSHRKEKPSSSLTSSQFADDDHSAHQPIIKSCQHRLANEHLSSSGSDSVPGSPLSPSKFHQKGFFPTPESSGHSSVGSSPGSSGQTSPQPEHFSRPRTLQGIRPSLQRSFCSPRRKSGTKMPVSPLARTPSPSRHLLGEMDQSSSLIAAEESPSTPIVTVVRRKGGGAITRPKSSHISTSDLPPSVVVDSSLRGSRRTTSMKQSKSTN